ncbi:MAG: metal-dependent hydrolase [Thermoplasmata archaeon]|nr:MAG: metal-dependent hydrolase [Thermoplasmata archaeon]
MIIFDNHLHLRRDGRFLEAVKDFKRTGGTHFILCQYPMTELVLREKSYMSCFMETLKMPDMIRSKIDVGVFVTVGPYPVDYLMLRKKFGREKAVDIMKKGMDLAAKLCEEQKCVAIGEIGRPHFPVERDVLEDSNMLLRYGMEIACDVDVPVVLHTETTTPEQCRELVELGKKAGLSSDKIVKHFSPPLITKEENHGLMPSVLASKKNIVEALGKGFRFMMETDYIDDPQRPGAVLGPKTIPRLTKKLLAMGVMSEEQAYHIHIKNPERTYAIVLE